MYQRISIRFITLLFALIFLPAADAFAQMCIGRTGYVVRDEAGAVMTAEKIKKLRVVSINGQELKFVKDSRDGFADYYETGHMRSFYKDNKVREFRYVQERILYMNNPLVFEWIPGNTFCGKIGDMTLEYGGKQMRLFFDIRDHNTYFQIDSLPFQEGTFHLRGLKCNDGAKPPLIDNNNSGKCVVAADNWEGMEKDWVRQLVWNDFWGGRIDPQGLDCRGKTTDVINTQKDWEAAWKLFREAANGNPLPAIDFKTEIVLMAYAPKAPPSIGYDALMVDKKGDLTVHLVPRPKQYDQKACTILLLAIYRSGIKTVEGKSLPPPASE